MFDRWLASVPGTISPNRTYIRSGTSKVMAGDDLTYTETAADGHNITFNFKRLGLRVPTLLISPWVGKELIEGKGTNNGGE
jgi:phospholipase C